MVNSIRRIERAIRAYSRVSAVSDDDSRRVAAARKVTRLATPRSARGGSGGNTEAYVTEARDLLVKRLRQTVGIEVRPQVITGDTVDCFNDLIRTVESGRLNCRGVGSGLRLQQTSSYLQSLKKISQIIKLQYPARLAEQSVILLEHGVPGDPAHFGNDTKASAWMVSEASRLGIEKAVPSSQNCTSMAALLQVLNAQRNAHETDLGGDELAALSAAKEYRHKLSEAVSLLARQQELSSAR